MAKVLLPQIGLDAVVYNKIEEERTKLKMPRATYINMKLKEVHNL